MDGKSKYLKRMENRKTVAKLARHSYKDSRVNGGSDKWDFEPAIPLALHKKWGREFKLNTATRELISAALELETKINSLEENKESAS
jgi:hypothetical protein